MGKTREIKKRIKAVGNIKRITRTMQMIATAKFSQALQRSTAGKPYSTALFELVGELAATAGDELSHPLLQSGGEGKALTLVLTSDRGLCGPFNGSVLRASMQHFRHAEGAREGFVEVVGKKGVGFYKFNGIEVTRHHSQFGDKPAYWVAASPHHALQAIATPTLAVCSTRRDDPCPQARAFAAKAGRLGVRAQVLEQDLSHAEINDQLGLAGPYTEAVEAFMGSLDAQVLRMLR